MVTTTGTQGVVVLALNAHGVEVLSSRGARLNGGSRGDVVGGHRVTQGSKDASALDVGNRCRLHFHLVEVRCLADVGGLVVPSEGLALRGRQVLPALVTSEDILVVLVVQLGGDGGLDGCFDLFGGRPNVA